MFVAYVEEALRVVGMALRGVITGTFHTTFNERYFIMCYAAITRCWNDDHSTNTYGSRCQTVVTTTV